MLGFLSADIICSEKQTDNVQGQISEHIFAPNRGAALEVMKMGDYLTLIIPWARVGFKMVNSQQSENEIIDLLNSVRLYTRKL